MDWQKEVKGIMDKTVETANVNLLREINKYLERAVKRFGNCELNCVVCGGEWMYYSGNVLVCTVAFRDECATVTPSTFFEKPDGRDS